MKVLLIIWLAGSDAPPVIIEQPEIHACYFQRDRLMDRPVWEEARFVALCVTEEKTK